MLWITPYSTAISCYFLKVILYYSAVLWALLYSRESRSVLNQSLAINAFLMNSEFLMSGHYIACLFSLCPCLTPLRYSCKLHKIH